MKTTLEQLETGLALVLQSPKDIGTLEMIVRRPRVDERQTLEQGELSPTEGLIGDTWKQRGSNATQDGSADADRQITIINSRLIELVAGDRQFWPLAGDQLYIDLDLSTENLPPGTQLAVGSVVLEVTAPPHRGCKKFAARFGLEPLEFISLPERKDLRLRGMHTRVVQPGSLCVGDLVYKK